MYKNEDFFIDNGVPLIKIELGPFVKGYLGGKLMESPEFFLCELLRFLKSFNECIRKARAELGLVVLEYPTKETIEEYLDFELEQTKKYGKKFEEEVEKILSRYSLGSNWKTSIAFTILTNTIFIPYRKSGIGYYIPKKKLKDPEEADTGDSSPKSLRDLSKTLANDIVIGWEVVKYPAIYFTEKITKESVIKWMKNHKHLIEAMNAHLPSKNRLATKLRERTAKVGQTAWLLIKDGGLIKDGIIMWAKMEKELAKMDEIDELSDWWGSNGVPTADELRLSYNSYTSLLKELDKGSES